MTLSTDLADKARELNRGRAVRKSPPDLAAYHWSGAYPKQESVRNISSSGVFLETNEHWNPGEVVSLTLQRRGPLEGNLERRVAVQARAVRREDDGMGMIFVLPDGMDLRLWNNPLMDVDERNEPEDVLREFRVAEALAFVQRICPGGAEDVRTLLREGLSNYRIASATEIALKAERVLALSADGARMKAPASLVLRVLENGSWADDESAQQLWAGLLATSCSYEGRDESNAIFVDLLSQLTSIHLRVLSAACTRGSKFYTSGERIGSRPLRLTAGEMTRVAGTRDLNRIHRDLEHLAELGLVTVTVRTASFAPIEGTDIAPTSIGLELYARCNGHRGRAQEFYGVQEMGGPDIFSEAEPAPRSGTIRPVK